MAKMKNISCAQNPKFIDIREKFIANRYKVKN